MNWLIRDCTGLENQQRIILHLNISLKQRILSFHVMPRIRKKIAFGKSGMRQFTTKGVQILFFRKRINFTSHLYLMNS